MCLPQNGNAEAVVLVWLGVAYAVLNLQGLSAYAATYPCFPDGMVLKADLLPIDQFENLFRSALKLVPGLPVIDNGATYVPIVIVLLSQVHRAFASTKRLMTDPSDDSVNHLRRRGGGRSENLFERLGVTPTSGGKGFDQEEYASNQFCKSRCQRN